MYLSLMRVQDLCELAIVFESCSSELSLVIIEKIAHNRGKYPIYQLYSIVEFILKSSSIRLVNVHLISIRYPI